MNHLTINDDGTVTAHLPGGDAVMRWPLGGEWDEIVAAHTKASAESAEPDSTMKRPNSVAFAVALGILTNATEPDPEKLPLWCGNPDVLVELRDHWQSVNIGHAVVPFDVLTFQPIPPDDSDG